VEKSHKPCLHDATADKVNKANRLIGSYKLNDSISTYFYQPDKYVELAKNKADRFIQMKLLYSEPPREMALSKFPFHSWQPIESYKRCKGKSECVSAITAHRTIKAIHFYGLVWR